MTVAQEPGARGVLVVMAGTVHGAVDVRKVHAHRLDAFSSGDAGPLGAVEDGGCAACAPGRRAMRSVWRVLDPEPGSWPSVEIVTSHAGASATLVDALARAGTRASSSPAPATAPCTTRSNSACSAPRGRGMVVLRTTRCGDGAILDAPDGNGQPGGACGPPPAR